MAQDGREKVLHLFPAGETLAEAALFGEGRYPATAQAVGPSTVAAFPRQALLQLLRDRPELCFRMLAGMSVKLKYLSQRIEELTFQSASMRLASHLVAELARRLAELAPPGLTRVFFSDNGATEIARPPLLALAATTGALERTGQLSTEVVLAQVRSIIVDLLQVSGLTVDEAVAVLPAVQAPRYDHEHHHDGHHGHDAGG